MRRGRGSATLLALLTLCQLLAAAAPARADPRADPPQRPEPAESSQGDSSGLVAALNELFAPAALLGDAGAIVTGEDPGSLIILAGGVGISAALIGNADDWAFGAIPEGTLGDLSDGLSTIGSAAVVLPALIGTFAAGKGLRKPGMTRTAAQMTQAILLSGLFVTPTKIAIGRQRPDGSNQHSYPSGHTATAFAVAGVLRHEYGVAGAIPGYAFAALMGVARIEGRKHYLSDVIAGAAIGAMAARAVGRRFGDRGLLVHPIQGPAGSTGIGLTIVY